MDADKDLLDDVFRAMRTDDSLRHGEHVRTVANHRLAKRARVTFSERGDQACLLRVEPLTSRQLHPILAIRPRARQAAAPQDCLACW